MNPTKTHDETETAAHTPDAPGCVLASCTTDREELARGAAANQLTYHAAMCKDCLTHAGEE